MVGWSLGVLESGNARRSETFVKRSSFRCKLLATPTLSFLRDNIALLCKSPWSLMLGT